MISALELRAERTVGRTGSFLIQSIGAGFQNRSMRTWRNGRRKGLKTLFCCVRHLVRLLRFAANLNRLMPQPNVTPESVLTARSQLGAMRSRRGISLRLVGRPQMWHEWAHADVAKW